MSFLTTPPLSPWPTLPLQPGQIALIPPNSDRLILPPSQSGTGGKGIYVQRVENISPETGAFSIRASHDEAVVDVPWSQRSNAMSRFLGYQYVEGTKLRRINPLAHGFYEFLRCRTITNVKGVVPRNDGARSPEQVGTDAPTVPTAAFPRPFYGEYLRCRMTLGFETVPFTFKSDADTIEEYERHCWVRPEIGFQALHIDGDTFAFDEGLVSTVTGSLSKAKAFPNGRSIPISVGRILITWYDVPLEFLTNVAGRYANFDKVLNHVNRYPFLGYPSGTLLCDLPHIDLRPNPLPVSVSATPSFLADVNLTLHYINPLPLGDGVAAIDDADLADHSSRGHNMAIWKGDRKWYPASLVQTTGANKGKADGTTRVYPAEDFKLLFRKPAG